MLHFRIQTTADISDVLRAQRNERSLSQSELAGRAGIGRQQISDIESGKSGMRVSSLLRLLDALDLDLHVVERTPTEDAHLNLDELLGLDDD